MAISFFKADAIEILRLSLILIAILIGINIGEDHFHIDASTILNIAFLAPAIIVIVSLLRLLTFAAMYYRNSNFYASYAAFRKKVKE